MSQTRLHRSEGVSSLLFILNNLFYMQRTFKFVLAAYLQFIKFIKQKVNISNQIIFYMMAYAIEFRCLSNNILKDFFSFNFLSSETVKTTLLTIKH